MVADGMRPGISSVSSSAPTRTGAEAVAARCDVSTPVMNARSVLTFSDVDPASGARAVTDTDYRYCTPVTTALGWRCDLPFPWQTAAATGSAMATLGVRHARVARVVTPRRSVSETILETDPGGGAHVLRELRRACAGSKEAMAAGWVRLGAHTAVLATGPVVVAVDFTDGSWTGAEKRRVLRAADVALGKD